MLRQSTPEEDEQSINSCLKTVVEVTAIFSRFNKFVLLFFFHRRVHTGVKREKTLSLS